MYPVTVDDLMAIADAGVVTTFGRIQKCQNAALRDVAGVRAGGEPPELWTGVRTTGVPSCRHAPCPASGVAARSMLPCARMTARPAVARCHTSAIVGANRSCGSHPANMSWRLRASQSYVLTPVIPCTAGSVPVAIVECRPISKRKAWRVVEIVERAHGFYALADPVHGLKVGRHKRGAPADPDEVRGPDGAERPEESDDEEQATVPALTEGEALARLGLEPKQHFTQPPPRYTEASLIKALEELGIGRPSTYASILSTIIHDRGYVRRERRTLFPTQLGVAVTEKLTPFFPEIMDVQFTAQMEDHLDKVEEGERNWVETVREFYKPFIADLERAKQEMEDEKGGVEVDEPCPECGSPLKRRWGRFGPFLACTRYPECRYTRDLSGRERAEDEPTDELCTECGRPMVIKHGRFGRFIACSGYPECKTTKPVTLGIACPEPGCPGELTERRSKRGRVFFGCSAYPNCKYALWQRPVAEACPRCQAPFLTERFLRGGRQVRACVRGDCEYKVELEPAGV